MKRKISSYFTSGFASYLLNDARHVFYETWDHFLNLRKTIIFYGDTLLNHFWLLLIPALVFMHLMDSSDTKLSPTLAGHLPFYILGWSLLSNKDRTEDSSRITSFSLLPAFVHLFIGVTGKKFCWHYTKLDIMKCYQGCQTVKFMENPVGTFDTSVWNVALRANTQLTHRHINKLVDALFK